ncbi:APC family permease [Mycoplasmopsis alligatoris]|uniref:Amino acid permease n=1 Tax=Mycoplasmopsis alligatoris A21JP2 TaxID=747682 RepID=D4XWW5_9BACT|nr:APC family permease [Mycoplasmopsis alligatoris]EFF41265.1 amino acid permease [Mycoplasmopsis alligatoris A21JP2]
MNKLNNKQLVFFGFNFVVGFGFIATMSELVVNKGWGILIFIISSFIALTVALSFSKLAHKYPDTVGGTYAYSKPVFNRPLQFFVGWTQFIQGLLISSTTPLFFATIMKEFDKNPDHEIYYTLVSLVIFSIIILVATFGIKTNKYVIFISSALKYLVIAGAVLLLLVNLFKGLYNGQVQPDLGGSDTIAKPSLLFAGIISFIIAFGGIESVAIISKDTNVKNFRKTLMFIFGLILIFYFIVYILFIFQPKTVGGPTFAGLYNSSLGLTGLVLFGIGMFFNRLSATSSFIFGYSRALVALAFDGFLPQVFTKTNKHGEYKNAILFFGLLNIVVMFLIGLLPKLISSDSQLSETFSKLLGVIAIFFLMQYFITIVIALIMHKKQILKIAMWEYIIYVVGSIVIMFCILSYMFPVMFNIFPLEVKEVWDIGNTIVLVSLIATIVLGYLISYLYWYLKKRKETNQLQTQTSTQNLDLNSDTKKN